MTAVAEEKIDAQDCTCAKCQNACQNKPGWFLPGEVECMAEHLGIPLEDLFKTKLMVDYWEADYLMDETFVLAPAIVGETPGEEYPSNPHGQCVFYKDGRCSIHAVKPFECRAYLHSQSQDETHERHRSVAQAWQDHQPQVSDLLGREPETSGGYDDGGLLGSLLGGRW